MLWAHKTGTSNPGKVVAGREGRVGLGVGVGEWCLPGEDDVKAESQRIGGS